MRVLFTCVRYLAHFHTLVPITRAVAAAGHEVAFATAEPLTPLIGPAGFRAGFHRFPAGEAPSPTGLCSPRS